MFAQFLSGSLKTAKNVILLALLASVLSGCAAALIGGAAVGGNSLANRRTLGTQIDDETIENRIHYKAKSALKGSPSASAYSPSLSIVSYNRRVLLLGHVASESDRQLVEQVARQDDNVKDVYNHIVVTPMARSMLDASNDTWITTKLRTRLLNVAGVYAGHVKVVTYNSVVYVMGMLTPQQQADVNQVVSTTAGVQKVVTLYENYP
ncbi:MAG: BON domain-containing protein [Alysiella sp.]|uniref:BON domain-containing protein n=1 Tax=Alysiella sp. TaxID=1872483 RepID=UPI0026DD20B0|nr:BON domain-containing protein [Alysiella sp.]MDO4433827.1 BON domain-containing protein [Alysiella sp.]